MRYQKLFVGLLFIIIFVGGVFSFFHFSFGDEVMKRIIEIIPNSFFYNIGNNDSDEEQLVEPIIKEDDNGVGFLTRDGIIQETNRQRELFTTLPLSENEKLNSVAQIKLDDMFENQYFAHVSPKGEGVSDIAKDLQYSFLLVGDNLAMGNYRDDQEIVGAWMNSPGHRKNILEERYEEIGVAAKEGVYMGKTIWMAVQVFAMPTSACPEVSELLKNEIDQKRKEAQNLLIAKDALEKEIDSIRPRGSELHIQKVDEYNSLVATYNELIALLDKAIDDYNSQIRAKEECISQ